MRVLLDTHALIWAVTGDKKLSRAALATLESFDNDVFVSAASAWEISTKHRIGRLPEAGIIVGNVSGILEQLGFRALPISIEHAERAGSLSGEHRDPFDRILIAQAQAENLSLVSNERIFDSFRISRIW